MSTIDHIAHLKFSEQARFLYSVIQSQGFAAMKTLPILTRPLFAGWLTFVMP